MVKQIGERDAVGGRYPFTPYPRGWFRVAFSDEIEPGDVKPIRYFGKELVLFRTEAGRARVFDAFCPHMGAHLGHGGNVVGESLRCPFHHWEFNDKGRCDSIPYSERIPRKAKVACWPIIERNGIVMVYFDPAKAAPDFEIPEVPEFQSGAWTTPEIAHWEVRASWLDMNENCVDQVHFKYIHGTLSIPPTKATTEGSVHRTVSKFRMRIPGGEGEAQLVTLDYGPGFQVVRITGLIDTILVNTATAIDSERTDVKFAYSVKVDGETRKMHLAEAIIKDLKQQFEHDLPIWENKAYWSKPVLCAGDGPIANYRNWYSQFV